MSRVITCPSRLTSRVRGAGSRGADLADRRLGKSGGQAEKLLRA